MKSKAYIEMLRELVSLLENARKASVRAVNFVMTTTYWEIGRRIFEEEQLGGSRAKNYGKEIVERLSVDLTKKFGRGFGRTNLFQMRAFYLAFPKIVQTPSGQSIGSQIFPLPWSHYVRLLSVQNTSARQFYLQEALKGGWSFRQLDRQISTLFYERSFNTKNKERIRDKGESRKSHAEELPEDQIKDPFVLEFLDLKDEYSERDLEEALIYHLESFLLELGGQFTFVGRQKRLRVGNEWYRVDLVFFHRRLKCLVLIDLKLGKFTHADAGQMHLYLNYAKEHWLYPEENPPVGLILCAEKDEMVAKYSLEGLPNKILAAQYRTSLPQEAELIAELQKTRKLLKQRKKMLPGIEGSC